MTTHSAPEFVRFCARCGTPMETRQIGDRPRRVCPSCEYIHFTDPKVGVGVAVWKDERILLVRRTMRPEIGKWSIPAGYLDAGEDPRETAVREVWEETGCHVQIDRLLDVYHNPPQEGGASVFIMYEGHVMGGELQAGDDADAAQFFALDQLPELAFASTRAAIRMLLEQSR